MASVAAPTGVSLNSTSTISVGKQNSIDLPVVPFEAFQATLGLQIALGT